MRARHDGYGKAPYGPKNGRGLTPRVSLSKTHRQTSSWKPQVAISAGTTKRCDVFRDWTISILVTTPSRRYFTAAGCKWQRRTRDDRARVSLQSSKAYSSAIRVACRFSRNLARLPRDPQAVGTAWRAIGTVRQTFAVVWHAQFCGSECPGEGMYRFRHIAILLSGSMRPPSSSRQSPNRRCSRLESLRSCIPAQP